MPHFRRELLDGFPHAHLAVLKTETAGPNSSDIPSFLFSLAKDCVADFKGQVHGVFGVSRWTKMSAVHHNNRVADVVSVEGCEIAFRPFIRNGGEAYWANGVERAIPILPVRK
jgi:hypothetical protein